MQVTPQYKLVPNCIWVDWDNLENSLAKEHNTKWPQLKYLGYWPIPFEHQAMLHT